jgi:hypothetical protein
MSHQRAVRPRPAPRRGNVPAYVMASLLMAAEISLAIAYSVGFFVDSEADHVGPRARVSGPSHGGRGCPQGRMGWCRSNANTVQLVTTASTAGRSGCGQSRWRARFTCQRVYLRLTTRGLARSRRFGRSRCSSSPMA